MRNLHNFVKDILIYKDAVVEDTDNQMEILAPFDLAEILQIPENTNLIFSPQENSKNIFLSYDSDIFKNILKLFNNQGKFCTINIPAQSVKIDKMESKLNNQIVLNNAIFQLDKKEELPISYILSFFKYTAISDETLEGITASLLNEFNLSTSYFNIEDLYVLSNNLQESLEGQRREEIEKVINAIGTGQMEIVQEQTKDFVKSLERRLNRDIHRVYDYYHSLINESQKYLEKKFLNEELKQKTLNKIEAIKTELKWKTNDLISKYKLNIQIEPISFIRIESKVPVLWIEIKRRKLSRLFPVTYNPIIRHMDNLPCESCFNPVKPYYICDEKLHIVCSKCFKTCPKCGKSYCSVCYKSGCPKCG